MKITLKKISLINFKGIRNFSTEFNHTTSIYGDNATGKTSLFDAFTWLLFGKDSTDRKDFEVKTLDADNKVIEKLDHEVSATMDVDGQTVMIKRIVKENWVTKRGSTTPELKGNDTLFFWNDVPLKAGEYQAKIGGIVDETLFKLITNTLYFNQMKWQDRRNVLMNIAGNITNDEVLFALGGNIEFAELLTVLNSGKTLAEYKKEIVAKKKLLKDSLETIPTRIDEANRSLPEEVDYIAIEQEKEALREEYAGIETILNDATKALSSHHEAVGKKQGKLFTLQTDLRNRQFEIKQSFSDGRRDRETTINNLVTDIRVKQSEIDSTKKHIDTQSGLATNYQNQVQKLREDWGIADKKQLEIKEEEFVCPTCKRALEAENIEEKRAEMLENFNTQKSNHLAGITSQGQKLASLLDELTNSINEFKGKESQLNNDLEALQYRFASLKAKHDDETANEEKQLADALANDQAANDINAQIIALQEEINNTKVDVPDNIEQLNRKRIITAEIENLNKQLNNKDQIAKIQARVKELQKEETTMAQQLADLEKTEFRIDQFNKAKMDTLETRINSRFKHVKFKLFEMQINGGEAECCETLINGVPFSDANNASKINAGLDIINTLCQHHNVYAPIFIDNRESVNNLIESDTQIVNLIVSQDKKLKVA